MAVLSKRATVYFDPGIHRVLKIKAAETSRSVSELIDDALRRELSEDEEDLRAFKERAAEKSVSFEKVLKDLESKGVVSYVPGDDDFEVLKPDALSESELAQLDKLKSEILSKFGGTGVQNILNKAVFDFLKMITVYPVHDVGSLSDGDGNVLPDVFLVPEGTTAKDFAGHIHTDLLESFIHAIDARTNMRIGDKHVLKDCDVIKIVSAKGT